MFRQWKAQASHTKSPRALARLLVIVGAEDRSEVTDTLKELPAYPQYAGILLR